MPETKAKPLKRLGGYSIAEKPWTNVLGPVVEGAALAAYWRELVASCVGQRERRAAAAKEVDAAAARGDLSEVGSILGSRYAMKIEIKSAEAVAALLHRILVPRAPFLCDELCPHVAQGASAGQVKRFLDTLDAACSSLRERWHACGYDHPCYEDLQDEHMIYDRWRTKLSAVARQPG